MNSTTFIDYLRLSIIGMEESKQDIPEDEEKSHWILWVFYFNPKDKRLFPPKRWGLGWTINFANPYSVACLLAIILVFNVVLMYVTHKATPK